MKKLCFLLAFMLLFLFSSQALADGNNSHLGTWHGYESGSPMSVTFEEKGVYRLSFYGFEKEHKGKYTLKDNVISLKYKKWDMDFVVGENELVAVYSDHYNDASLPDGLFTHEPLEVGLPCREKLKAESPEQFSGIWKLRCLCWWDSQYMCDMEHYSGRSVLSLNPDPATQVYFIRIDTEKNCAEFMDADRSVMETHSLKWKNGTYYDSFYSDTYTLMEDGSLSFGDKTSSIYICKADE